MPIPNCRIKIYNTSNELTHTITTDVLNCSFTDEFTTSTGSFTFTLPAIKGRTSVYDDIGNHYKATIELGYDGSYTHLFTGKISDFTTQVAQDAIRVFEGKSLGEILERVFIRDTRWQDEDASDIVTDLYAAMGATGSTGTIDTTTTDETLTVETETIFDALRKTSDYWYDASTKVTKDFGFDKDYKFFWKARPLRTSGVETITNVLGYTLKRAILGSKNYITVYGAASAAYPLDRDQFTDALDGWTANTNDVTLSSGGGLGVKEGTYRIHTEGEDSYASIELQLPKRINLRNITTLYFWHVSDVYDLSVYLYAPDASNCFYTSLAESTGWAFFEQALGENNEYSADARPTAAWRKIGNPNWWNIQKIAFISSPSVGAFSLDIDKLYFYPERWTSFAKDDTNIASYGKREAEYTDDKLLSISECNKRANTLLYQQKDRVLRLDFTVPGNTNILLGDQLTMTLPLDNVTAQAFDVVSVTHVYNKAPQGYLTSCKCLGTSDTRRLPPMTPLESIRLTQKGTKDVLSQNYQSIIK